MSFLNQFPSLRYARVPLEVLLDTRIARRHLVVLSAILLHADNDGFAWPTVHTLSEITGFSRTEVSRTTTDLLKLGYIGKKQTGFNMPTKYQVMCPSYEPSVLRKISNKKLSKENYEAKLEAAKQESLAREVSVRLANGEVSSMTAHELADQLCIATFHGWESVGITKTEFARHGLYLNDKTAPGR